MKTKHLFAAFIIFAGLIGGSSVRAQESESESPISVGADFMSRYVWRGLDFGASPSIQPFIEYSKGNFGIGAWGAYTTNINNPAQEMDLYAYYNIGDEFTVTLTDYFFPTDAANNAYLLLDSNSTHTLEAMVSFNGTEDLPLWVTAAMNLTNDVDNSIYAEVGYSFANADVFMGFGNGIYTSGGMYVADGSFQGINFGMSTSKDIKITEDFSLPVSGSLIVNPNTENVFLVFGFSL